MAKANIFIKVDNTLVIPYGEIFKKFDGAKEFGNIISTHNVNNKKAYINLLPTIVEAGNELFGNMDNEDEEILFNFCNLRYLITEEDLTADEFIEKLYEIIVDDIFVKKISDYIDEHYVSMLDKTDNNKKNHSEELEFTDEHVMILQKISLAQKVLIPIIGEYINKNMNKTIDNTNDFLFDAYHDLFDKFQGDIQILLKIYKSVESRIKITQYSDSSIWEKLKEMGYTIKNYIDIVYKKIIIDIMPKYSLHKNIVSLNHVVINNTRENLFHLKFQISYKTLTKTVSSDGEEVSEFERIEMMNAKNNESINILSEEIIKDNIKLLYDPLNIKDDEYNFYYQNCKKINNLQKNLLFCYFADKFSGAKTLYNCTYAEYIKLLIVFKKDLERHNLTNMSRIITAGLKSNVNEKRSIGKKNLIKLLSSQKYKLLTEEKYASTLNIFENKSILLSLLASVINTEFIENDYNNDTNGEILKIEINIVLNEILDYLYLV